MMEKVVLFIDMYPPRWTKPTEEAEEKLKSTDLMVRRNKKKMAFAFGC